MEAGNGMPGGMLPASSWPATGNGHPQQQQQQQQLLNHHHRLLPFSVPDASHRPQLQQQQQQIPHPNSTYLANKGKHPSPEEEPDEDGTSDATKRAAAPSPWHRMKWTDDMVRLLIKIVYCMGDDGATTTEGGGGGEVASASKVKKTAAAAALQQKKGKWKSVSRAMMENGFYVSPQQCEDKFNDLNKRYKRVNELLGKGNGCRVVENQALLDTMTHLTPKAKEEARKLLNSKHLFFREMCAYHHGGGAANASPCSASATAAPAAPLPPPPPPAAQCVHASPEAANDDAESDDDENDYGDEEEDDDASACSKRRRAAAGQSPPLSLSLWSEPAATAVQQLRRELEGARGQQRQWLRRKTEELEEQRVGYQCQALRYERERFRWLRYCGNKEREMEERMLNNQRLRLENERMLLMLKKQEFELGSAARGGGSGSSLSVQPSTTMDRSAAGAAGMFDVQ